MEPAISFKGNVSVRTYKHTRARAAVYTARCLIGDEGPKEGWKGEKNRKPLYKLILGGYENQYGPP